MSLTLVEASKYSNDVLQRGVIEELVKDDAILERMKFKDIKGNGLTYNTETTLSGAQFFNVNEEWVESTGTITPATAFTKILGGDADVDNFLRTTRSNFNDLMQEQIVAKTKAIKRAFIDMALYGDVDVDTKGFNGLHKLLTSLTLNTVTLATSSGTPVLLTLIKAEEAIDMIKNGNADVCHMSKQLRRHVNKYLNGIGGITKTEIQGKTVQTIFEVPIVVSDHQSDGESADLDYGSSQYGHNYAEGTAHADNDGATSIFFMQFSDKGFAGVQSAPLTTEKWAKLETKDASRVRIKWYPGVMLQSLISCSKITGIDVDGVVAA
jgi:hypothetical protein